MADTSDKPVLACPSVNGALSVHNGQLTDAGGNPVLLRGISTHGIAWYPQYINRECFHSLKTQFGANAVRLAMYTAEYGGYCAGGDQDQLKELIRSGIQYAQEEDMYVIVDWHILSDKDPNRYVKYARAFFSEISEEFSQCNHILYEICNEPNGNVTWNKIRKYANKVIPVIRANDPDAVIIVGTPKWSQTVSAAAKKPLSSWSNIMYAFHFYAATHKDSMRTSLEKVLKKNLPVFVTEFGICEASGSGNIDLQQAKEWMDLLDSYNISCMMWNLSNKDETCALLKTSCTKVSGFTQDDLSETGKWLVQMLGGSLLQGGGSDSSLPDNTPAQTQPEIPGSDTEQADQNSAPAPSPSDAPAEETEISTGSVIPGSAASGQLEGKEITWNLRVANRWTTGSANCVQYALTLTNAGSSPCNSWSIRIPFQPQRTLTLTDSWCGVYSLSDNTLSISPVSYNATIQPGESITNIGFILQEG